MESSSSTSISDDGLQYLTGFGNNFESEALAGALPTDQNSPQVCPMGLYSEQLSGTAFTAPRALNQKVWFYRIRPSVVQGVFRPIDTGLKRDLVADPNQIRWGAFAVDETRRHDFVDGLRLLCGAGDPRTKAGLAIYVFTATASMGRRCMYNSDGDFLIVPQSGALLLTTEMGKMHVAAGEICVMPRGIKFSVDVDGPVRGYILEIYNSHFEIPSLGPIGANGLANPRHFKTPVAAFEDREGAYLMVNKYSGQMFQAEVGHCPFDVVAWHGNYVPSKYDLALFNTMNSVSFDHPDPSIYTVLTATVGQGGGTLTDFVIFPPRWMVMEHSFRPPYYHRNTMAEFMGMIRGKYDAKEGFVPGGGSLHNVMTAHGPDEQVFEKASVAALDPAYFDGGLAFMFESVYFLDVSQSALECPEREVDYPHCWQSLQKHFVPPAMPPTPP
jgi:homogentisate 1,2-dioxygenase